jgi:hypothetical protein
VSYPHADQYRALSTLRAFKQRESAYHSPDRSFDNGRFRYFAVLACR